MKRKLVCTAIAVLAIMFSHAAFAAPPDLLGEWNGSGKAIYPGGDTVDFNITGTVDHQVGNLLDGFFEFALTDVPDSPTFTVYFTGHISLNKTIKLQMTAEGSTFGTGVAEAEWMGNKIEGVVRDASDGSTGYFVFEPAQ
jgi:hypothetical protein